MEKVEAGLWRGYGGVWGVRVEGGGRRVAGGG